MLCGKRLDLLFERRQSFFYCHKFTAPLRSAFLSCLFNCDALLFFKTDEHIFQKRFCCGNIKSSDAPLKLVTDRMGVSEYFSGLVMMMQVRNICGIVPLKRRITKNAQIRFLS